MNVDVVLKILHLMKWMMYQMKWNEMKLKVLYALATNKNLFCGSFEVWATNSSTSIIWCSFCCYDKLEKIKIICASKDINWIEENWKLAVVRDISRSCLGEIILFTATSLHDNHVDNIAWIFWFKHIWFTTWPQLLHLLYK